MKKVFVTNVTTPESRCRVEWILQVQREQPDEDELFPLHCRDAHFVQIKQANVSSCMFSRVRAHNQIEFNDTLTYGKPVGFVKVKSSSFEIQHSVHISSCIFS